MMKLNIIKTGTGATQTRPAHSRFTFHSSLSPSAFIASSSAVFFPLGYFVVSYPSQTFQSLSQLSRPQGGFSKIFEIFGKNKKIFRHLQNL
jgi:hypothetical protein